MRPCSIIDLAKMPYNEALALQRETVRAVKGGSAPDTMYFVEHPSVLTVGRNADGSAITADPAFVKQRGVDVVETDRGGDVTYHGPGQLVGYPIVALEEGRRDIRRFVKDLEEALIMTLADFGIEGFRDEKHRGVWTANGKIASVGLRISRWVTSHGFALNVSTDLSFFDLLHPCGIVGCRMTSIENETGKADMRLVKERVAVHFGSVFERQMVTHDDRKLNAG